MVSLSEIHKNEHTIALIMSAGRTIRMFHLRFATLICMRFGSRDFFSLLFLHILYMRLVSLICTLLNMYTYIHNLKGFIKHGAFLYFLQASLSSVDLKFALHIEPSTAYNKNKHNYPSPKPEVT